MEFAKNNHQKIPPVGIFLAITFGLMFIGWGSCALLSQTLNWTVNHPVIQVLFLVGGFSPTVASYVVMRKYQFARSLWDWLKQVFDVKHSLSTYICVLLFVAIYYILGCAINDFELGAPVFMLLVIVPMMLFGGGNEEVGWRMILQPELEKRFGFHTAVWITAIIWWIWHTPLFFIQGTANASMNYFLFGIMCLTLSYALGTIRKISNGVFPCILTHCLINGLSATFVFQFSTMSCCLTLFVVVLLSILILKFHPQKEQKKSYDVEK